MLGSFFYLYSKFLLMKYIPVFLIFITVLSCKTVAKKNAKANNDKVTQNDTIKISNPDIEYDIIIIEPGFNAWLQTVAKPKGFYSKTYLENKNYQYTVEWNNRVNQPQRFDSNLYEMYIDYLQNVDYGYDVNYQLYNYFVYFQNRYQQNLLGGRIPTN